MHTEPDAVRPFRIEVAQADLDDLRRRLAATRWPDGLPYVGWERGVPPAHLRTLATAWHDDYDWRVHEARLNDLPHFTTDIDGQTIHFLHVRSTRQDATPLLLLHGWPGSFLWFTSVLERLASGDGAFGDRASGEGEVDGGDAPAFHLVVPSLPGFGYSPLSGPGWGSERMAGTLLALMTRLGYDRFGVQGSDTGAFVAPAMARQAPERVVGVHLNALITFPFGVDGELDGLDADDQRRWAAMEAYNDGYLQIQAKSPHTLAYGLHDSPVAQLAWILEMYERLTDKPDDVRVEEVLGLDHLLTTASLYWLTGTGGTSAQVYYEDITAVDWGDGDDWDGGDAGWDGEGAPADDAQAGEAGEAGWAMPTPTVPTAVLLAKTDVTVRRFAERDHHLVRWTELERGGHFLALEQPERFTEDIRAFFASIPAV